MLINQGSVQSRTTGSRLFPPIFSVSFPHITFLVVEQDKKRDIKTSKSRRMVMNQLLLVTFFFYSLVHCFCLVEAFSSSSRCRLKDYQSHQRQYNKKLYGWFDNFWQSSEESSSSTSSRQQEYPEQYPATYELNDITLQDDDDDKNKIILRRLLKNTQLESRPLTLAYQATRDGWTAPSFHSLVDTKGASVILATTKDGQLVGGYNPKVSEEKEKK